jgi:hypothetical protein
MSRRDEHRLRESFHADQTVPWPKPKTRSIAGWAGLSNEMTVHVRMVRVVFHSSSDLEIDSLWLEPKHPDRALHGKYQD